MTETPLPHVITRTIEIQAPIDTVFAFFTDNARWASWWGPGSTIDPRVGGGVHIRYPNGIEASGTVLEIAAPHHLVFSFGFASGQPIAPGASRVAIRLSPVDAGTRVHLRHELADAAVRDQFVQGWRYQLSVFANVASDAVMSHPEALADAWLALWSEPDAATRASTLARIAHADVVFRDRYSHVTGADDLLPHIAASQRFMPGIHLERTGPGRYCQGTLLCDWRMVGTDGQPRGTGTNVFSIRADGRIGQVTGLAAKA